LRKREGARAVAKIGAAAITGIDGEYQRRPGIGGHSQSDVLPAGNLRLRSTPRGIDARELDARE